MGFNWIHRRLLTTCALLGLVVGAGIASSCLIPEDLSECSADSDCRDKYSKTAYCADDGVCETYTREQYLEPPCDYQTYGKPYESDKPVIGAILAGSANSDNLMTAVEVAYQEFQNSAHGDFSVVVCNSKSDNELARDAAEHLASIGVEAIVGPDSSTQVIDLGQDIFVPQRMLSVSPAATSAVISTIQDEEMLWRTIPSDEFQATALAKLALSRMGLSPDATSLQGNKLMVAAKANDPYTQGLRSGVIETLATDITNSSDFKTISFPNPSETEGTPSFTDTADQINNFQPDTVLVFGTEEIWSVINAAETSMSTGGNRPLYITADGGNVDIQEEGAAKSAVSQHSSLVSESRVIGTRPATDYAGNPVYSSFANSWEDKKDIGDGKSASDFPFIAEAYDAFFLIGIASLGVDKFTGPNLAAQIPKITDPDGTSINAWTSGIGKAVNKFSKGEKFQLRGATGPLSFDEDGNPKGGTVALWCLEGTDQNDAGTKTADEYLVNSGSEFTPRDCPDASSM